MAEKQVTVPVALERVEPRLLRLATLLQRLGLLEESLGLRDLAGLESGACQGHPRKHLPGLIFAAVGEFDASLRMDHGLGQVSEGQGQLA